MRKVALYAIGAALLLSVALNVVLLRSISRKQPDAPMKTSPPLDAKERLESRPPARAIEPRQTEGPRPAPGGPGVPPPSRRIPGNEPAPERLPRGASMPAGLPASPSEGPAASLPPIPAEPDAGGPPAPEPVPLPARAERPPAGPTSPAEASGRPRSDVPGEAARLSVAPPPSDTAPEGEPEASDAHNAPAPAADDPSQDRTPPVLELLRFDPAEVTDGSVATLMIRASDDLSGVGSVKGVVNNPSGTAVVEFQAQGDGGPDGVFVARIAIPRKAETGVWYVAGLAVLDRTSNLLNERFTAETVPQGGRLLVLSADSDSTPPEVLSFWVDQPSVNAGERNAIRIEAHDDRSGVAGVRGEFWSPSRTGVIPFLCRPAAEPGFWEDVLTIPANAECGRWTLQSLRATDRADNTATYAGNSPQAADATFVVVGGDCGVTPPALERLDLSPTVVSNESASEIRVTAQLSDPGGRAISLSAWVSGPVSTSGQVPKIYFTFVRSSKDPEAPWIGTISVAQFAAKGTWRIDLVWLKDNALSTTSYTSDDPVLADAVFEVR